MPACSSQRPNGFHHFHGVPNVSSDAKGFLWEKAGFCHLRTWEKAGFPPLSHFFSFGGEIQLKNNLLKEEGHYSVF